MTKDAKNNLIALLCGYVQAAASAYDADRDTWKHEKEVEKRLRLTRYDEDKQRELATDLRDIEKRRTDYARDWYKAREKFITLAGIAPEIYGGIKSDRDYARDMWDRAIDKAQSGRKFEKIIQDMMIDTTMQIIMHIHTKK